MLKKFISYVLVLISLITVFNVRVFAMDEIGSITIDVIHQEDKDGNRIDTPIPDVQFDVYHIWTYDNLDDPENIEIVFNDPFKDVVEINAKMSEDEIQKTASLFLNHINESNKLLTSFKSNSSGRIVLNDLKIGAYLFVCNEIIEYNGALYQIMPFLITIPRKINGEYVYDVNAYPKLSIVKDEPSLEKKVNGVYEYELKADYEPVTYSIHTTMPKLADEFRIRDTLEPVLEFIEYKNLNELISVTIGSTKLSLSELKKQVTIDGQTLVVEFTKKQLKEFKDQEVTIEFKAKIIEGADLSKYETKRVPNDCEYEINNIFKKSNRVYITPPPKKRTPPKTGILIIDTIVENPWYMMGFVLMVLMLVLGVLRKYRRQNS